jgi:hypothetical protein
LALSSIEVTRVISTRISIVAVFIDKCAQGGRWVALVDSTIGAVITDRWEEATIGRVTQIERTGITV